MTRDETMIHSHYILYLYSIVEFVRISFTSNVTKSIFIYILGFFFCWPTSIELKHIMQLFLIWHNFFYWFSQLLTEIMYCMRHDNQVDKLCWISFWEEGASSSGICMDIWQFASILHFSRIFLLILFS